MEMIALAHYKLIHSENLISEKQTAIATKYFISTMINMCDRWLFFSKDTNDYQAKILEYFALKLSEQK